MTATPLVNLSSLVDNAKCFELVRQHRWPEGVRCPICDSASVVRDGHDDTQPHRQRYRCKGCASRFDDLTGTPLAGHHRPLRIWVLCLYFMGLNLSNRQIAQELDLSGSDVQVMTEHLRSGLVAKTPAVTLDGEVEIDEIPCWTSSLKTVVPMRGRMPACSLQSRTRRASARAFGPP